MPRGRRAKAAESGAGDASNGAAESTHKCPEVNKREVQWEWEGDGGKWMPFSRKHALEITDAYNSGKKEVSLAVGTGIQMKVVFERMVQKNSKTGWERRLRCGLRSSPEEDFTLWQWEDEHGKWNPYSLEVSLELETSHESDQSDVEFTACKRAYTVDVKSMKQTNKATNVERNVRREQIKAQTPAEDPKVEVKVEDEEEEEMDTTTKRKSSRGKSVASGRKRKSAREQAEENGEEPEDKKVKTVVVKGKAPVDLECSKKSTAHVYCEGKDIYDAMLNQTNIGQNNNKFYLLQLLEDDGKKNYSVWFRWGRVGKTGQMNLTPCGPSLEQAKKVFCDKFYDKTRNQWGERSSFVKVHGKYDLVELDYGHDDADAGPSVEEPKDKKPVKVPDSKLDKRLQALIDLICDVKQMEAAVKEMKYDARKAPLGKLTQGQIKAGYIALKTVEALINKGDLGTRLTEACSQFYTRIPHDFGMRTPPVIRTKMELKAKLQLLEALSDIEVAMKIIKEHKSTENPLDTHYYSLKCELSTLDSSDADYKMIEDYLQNTHAATHNQYKMQILECFAVEKDQEATNFKDYGNRILLWHGSRLTNWVGILSQGLRIAPPEAPVTGYMFGKGVYFADMSSKSANYCFATASNNTGVLLLCEVSLGKCNELLAADYGADKLPDGCHSVWGKGKIAPNPKHNFTMADGTVVPLGKGIDTGVSNPSGYTLNYNEFVVYDVSQVKMRYLLKVKFNFK